MSTKRIAWVDVAKGVGAQLPLFSVSLYLFNAFNIYSMNMFWGGVIGVATSCLVLLMLLQVKPLYNKMYCKLCGK